MNYTKDGVREVFDTLAARSWEALYSGEVDRVSYNFVTRQRAVEEFLAQHVASGARVVDVGCGTGDLLPFYISKGASYVGVDLSVKMIERARAKFANHGAACRAEFIEGDSEMLPLSDGEADVVSAVALLEYLPDAARSLDEIARVLRPGGIAVITVPHKSCINFKVRGVLAPARRLLFPLYQKISGESELHVMRHVAHTHYDPEELDMLMKARTFGKAGGRFTNFGVVLHPLDHVVPKTYMKVSELIERSGRQQKFRRFAANYIGLYEKGREQAWK